MAKGRLGLRYGDKGLDLIAAPNLHPKLQRTATVFCPDRQGLPLADRFGAFIRRISDVNGLSFSVHISTRKWETFGGLLKWGQLEPRTAGRQGRWRAIKSFCSQLWRTSLRHRGNREKLNLLNDQNLQTRIRRHRPFAAIWHSLRLGRIRARPNSSKAAACAARCALSPPANPRACTGVIARVVASIPAHPHPCSWLSNARLTR